MSFIKEYLAYSSLSPRQKEFVKVKYIENSHTPSEWLAFFSKIAVYDRHGDAARNVLKKAGCATGAAAFISIFISAFFETWLPILLLAPIAIITVVLYFIRKKSDLPNNFRKFLVPMVSILREEMKPGEPLFLHIDLRGGLLNSKEVPAPRLRTTDKISRWSSGNISESFYSDRWLEARGVLADKSRLELQVRDFIRKRVVTRRNARGKTKVKTKYKVKSTIDARLHLPQDDYAVMSAGASGGEKINIKPGEKRSAIRVRRTVIARDLESVVPFNQGVDVIARAYRQVKLNQRGESK
ncbi:MAG TPA: hypothetical protein VLD57_12825 [Blastocatellia bacterium]|nr:hypothetical protein [Blastocatellia bacterium]